jgi:hypothetical protein
VCLSPGVLCYVLIYTTFPHRLRCLVLPVHRLRQNKKRLDYFTHNSPDPAYGGRIGSSRWCFYACLASLAFHWVLQLSLPCHCCIHRCSVYLHHLSQCALGIASMGDLCLSRLVTLSKRRESFSRRRVRIQGMGRPESPGSDLFTHGCCTTECRWNFCCCRVTCMNILVRFWN